MKKLLLPLLLMMCLLGGVFAEEKKESQSQLPNKIPPAGTTIEGEAFLKSIEKEADFVKQDIISSVVGRDVHVQVNIQLIQVQNSRGCYAIYSGLYTIYTTNQEFVRCLNIGDRIDVVGKIHVDTNLASSGAVYMFIYPAKITVLSQKGSKSSKSVTSVKSRSKK